MFGYKLAFVLNEFFSEVKYLMIITKIFIEDIWWKDLITDDPETDHCIQRMKLMYFKGKCSKVM